MKASITQQQWEKALFRIEKLEKEVRELRNSTFNESILPPLCREHRCTYFEHYLAYGPAELTHEGFHAAEQHCTTAQLRLQQWMENHPTGELPASLEALCKSWEMRIRA